MKDKKSFPLFDKAYKCFFNTIVSYGWEEKIKQGVLVGLSGGPDSVLLFHLLLRYKQENDFKMVAAHLHHGLRDTADRDVEFSKQLCNHYGVEYISKKVDVNAISKEHGIGLEEAGRLARYNYFNDIIQGRNDVSFIALGHNATDNLETVIFHLVRGCGTGGLAGIPPFRDNIIRPLIGISKSDILAALHEADLPFVIDETNEDVIYTRNYIRHEIIPKLSRISSNPEVSVARVCHNLISDNSYLELEANKQYTLLSSENNKPLFLKSLHPAIFARVISIWSREFGISLNKNQIDKMFELLMRGGYFRYDLAGNYSFVCLRNTCGFELKSEKCLSEKAESYFSASEDHSILTDEGLFSFLTDESQIISSNIYNFSIKVNLSSAIIEGELFVRCRQDGDSYFYGGMTHKLKKLFNDKKVSLEDRNKIPILCDRKGIVWVPGFGVRDDGGDPKNTFFVTFSTNTQFYFSNAKKGTES